MWGYDVEKRWSHADICMGISIEQVSLTQATHLLDPSHSNQRLIQISVPLVVIYTLTYQNSKLFIYNLNFYIFDQLNGEC